VGLEVEVVESHPLRGVVYFDDSEFVVDEFVPTFGHRLERLLGGGFDDVAFAVVSCRVDTDGAAEASEVPVWAVGGFA